MQEYNLNSKNEIREVLESQIQRMEAKLRFIVENAEDMITQIRIKQAEELAKYATSSDVYSLWRGSTMEFYVLGNLMNKEYSEIRRDMNKRLNPENEELKQQSEEIEEEERVSEEKPSFKHEGTIHADQLTTEMITLVQLTEMESNVMHKLVDRGLWYNWGSEPTFSDVTIEDLKHITGIEGRQLRGVLSSLTKKKMVFVDEIPCFSSNGLKIIYPTYFTYKAYEANNEYIKDHFGVESEE